MNRQKIGLFLCSCVGIFPSPGYALSVEPTSCRDITNLCPYLVVSVPKSQQKSQPAFFSLSKQEINPFSLSAQTLIRLLTQHYFTYKALGNIVPNLTLKEGYQIQAGFVQELSPHLGKPVGYKVGLTNAIAQERLQVNHPVKGILLEKMLLQNGAKVKPNFGAIPRLEGDLMVRVGSEQINQAKTPQEVLQSLDAVIPFVELPDLMYQPDVPLTGAKLVAVNVGTRLGVMGKSIPLNSQQELPENLSQIRVIIKDNTGKELATGSSDSLLGDPLTVVLWLRDALKSQGETLKKGDLISLGSMTPFLQIPSGQKITAQYWGLQENKPVKIEINFLD